VRTRARAGAERVCIVSFFFWLALTLATILTLAYRRVDLRRSTIVLGILLVAYLFVGDGSGWWKALLVLAFAPLAALNSAELRREYLTRPLLAKYRRLLPSMSETERQALDAGTVWWDGELFSGAPAWNRLLSIPAPRLSVDEQAFLDGPVNELCAMLDDWEITHERADLPPEVWSYLKAKGFFAMIIPKKYGGLEFSALAHSSVLAKIAGRSVTAASVVAVPNSLGPAELLHKYGTEEQKDHYLPRLARGEDIPCFALTSPRAGSDATSITDSGVVCRGTFEGREVVGIRLNWDKRYITLAPVATVLGLAFRLYDPDHLLGDVEDIGITCALIPTHLPGVQIGRRHFPLNIPFQNGPTQGKDVFVPVDAIIGGPRMAGHGWKMLVESLSVGRCISLPSNATGGAKAAVAVTGAYARLRRQFGMPVGRFEGVEEVLARIAGRAYIMEATRVMTAGAVDLGEEPAVPSAIVKYHLTEMGREVANDAMDVHGGKGIMLGPRNYLGRGYQGVPIMITVEGANILTRGMIIYGQGAIRCHPFVLRELRAAQDPDEEQGLHEFDSALMGHIGYALSNAARSLVLAATFARWSDVPVHGPTRRYFQHINRFAASFALVSDSAMLLLGGKLKKKEMLSARLGDILSYMYLASAVLKRFEDQGRPDADLALVTWACRDLLYRAQERLHGILRNFPNRYVAGLLRMLVFPVGRNYYMPSDRLDHKIASLMVNSTDARARLTAGLYDELHPRNPLGQLNEALRLADDVDPLEKRVRRAAKDGQIRERDFPEMIADAQAAGVLSESEARQLREFDERVMALMAVDDFDPEELARVAVEPRRWELRAARG
jgi:acyl-CoA dehydrogenase